MVGLVAVRTATASVATVEASYLLAFVPNETCLRSLLLTDSLTTFIASSASERWRVWREFYFYLGQTGEWLHQVVPPSFGRSGSVAGSSLIREAKRRFQYSTSSASTAIFNMFGVTDACAGSTPSRVPRGPAGRARASMELDE